MELKAFLLLSALVHGVQAALADHIARYISDNLVAPLVVRRDKVGRLSHCTVHEGGVKRCSFPAMRLEEETFSFQVHGDELNLLSQSLGSPGRSLIRTGKTSTYSATTISCTKVETDATYVEGTLHYECDGQHAYEANFVQIPDENGELRTFGSIVMGNHVCHISPNLTGNDEISCTPGSEFEDDGGTTDDLEQDDEESNSLRQRRIEAKFNHVKSGLVESLNEGKHAVLDDSGSSIDLMVVWTKKAECFYAGLPEGCAPTASSAARMRGLITLAMGETNTAFSESGVNTTLRLVHSYRHEEYVEPASSLQEIIRHVQNVDDGEMEDVHAKRILYGADVVHVIAGGNPRGGSCGAGHSGPAKALMFSVSRVACAVGYYAFGHEIAHNLGAHHDRGARNKCGDENSSDYGYKDPEAGFRSIMSYQCNVNQCDNMPKNGCPRIQRFSSSNREYHGKPIGNTMANNVEAMNANLEIVAGHFPAMHCRQDSNCDDHDASTMDTCTVNTGVCVFTPMSAMTNAPTMAPPAAEGQLESFVVTGVTSEWQTRLLRHAYTSPVIVCSVVPYGGNGSTDPSFVVRMRSVKSRSFDLRLQIPGKMVSSVGGPAAHPPIHCLAAEQGVWTLPDGRKLEAHMYLSRVTDSHTNGWVGERHTFLHSYEAPVVVGQVMSSQDIQWSTFWTNGGGDGEDESYFTTGKHVGDGDAHSTRRANEMVGMIVMESLGHDMVAGVEIASGRGVAFGDDQWSFMTSSFRWNIPPRVIVASPLRRTMTSDTTTTASSVDDVDTSDDDIRPIESLSYVAFGLQGLVPLRN